MKETVSQPPQPHPPGSPQTRRQRHLGNGVAIRLFFRGVLSQFLKNGVSRGQVWSGVPLGLLFAFSGGSFLQRAMPLRRGTVRGRLASEPAREKSCQGIRWCAATTSLPIWVSCGSALGGREIQRPTPTQMSDPTKDQENKIMIAAAPCDLIRMNTGTVDDAAAASGAPLEAPSDMLAV